MNEKILMLYRNSDPRQTISKEVLLIIAKNHGWSFSSRNSPAEILRLIKDKLAEKNPEYTRVQFLLEQLVDTRAITAALMRISHSVKFVRDSDDQKIPWSEILQKYFKTDDALIAAQMLIVDYVKKPELESA